MAWVMPILYLKEQKMQPGVGNGHQNLLTMEEDCIFMRLSRMYELCKWHQVSNEASNEAVSDLELSIFLQWVWLKIDSIGATPTRQPSLRFLNYR